MRLKSISEIIIFTLSPNTKHVPECREKISGVGIACQPPIDDINNWLARLSPKQNSRGRARLTSAIAVYYVIFQVLNNKSTNEE